MKIATGVLLLLASSAEAGTPRIIVRQVLLPGVGVLLPDGYRARNVRITFSNHKDRTISVLDLVIYDGEGEEVTNFRRPHGRIVPLLPLNIEPHRALQVTIELSEDQLARARMLEWEEGDGTKHRLEWMQGA